MHAASDPVGQTPQSQTARGWEEGGLDAIVHVARRESEYRRPAMPAAAVDHFFVFFFTGFRFTTLAATFLFAFFFFFLGASAVCVSADAASTLISALVSPAGSLSPFEAIFATVADVFSFSAMVVSSVC